jgi:PKD repeat protein
VRRKKMLPLSILLLIVLSVLSVDMIGVSAVVSPYIAVIPQSTVDPNLEPGMNYTVSIYTDYVGTSEAWDYITGYQFTLSYNPSVLTGIEVVNGDLIVPGPENKSTKFIAGPFDNVAGELSLTVGYYTTAGDVTQGPGTLANVTFTVVGYGASGITIDSSTKLKGWAIFPPPAHNFDIIDAADDPDQIGHGYFQNVETITRDVAVTSVTPASTSVAVGTSVDIMVDVTNEGDINEGFDVTAYANATPIGMQTVANLGSGLIKSLTFTWDTTGFALGNYAINATASTVPDETDTADNTLVSAPVTVREPIIPVAVIIIQTEDADYYVNQTIILDGISSYDPDGGTIVAYEWDFDDGNYATGRQVSHEYTTIGTYYVSLIVTDSQDQVSNPAYVIITCEEDPVIPPDYYADLIKWKAKAEQRSWDYSNDVDKLVTLTALASNMGLENVSVTVSYALIDYKTLGSAGPVITENRTLYADGLQVEITTDLDPYDYTYEGEKLELFVEVTLTYDSDGDEIPDTEGLTKTFRLTVKP